jgi:(S)-mandelate dehydrogenase
MGLNGVCRPEGDILLARAAARAGVPFVLSTASTNTVEDVVAAGDGEVWFQLYVLDRVAADTLVTRAWQAGCRTLVLTVDVAVNGERLRDKRSGFGVPYRYTPRVLADAMAHPSWTLRQLWHGLPELVHFRAGDGSGSVEAQAALMQRRMDASFDWDALARLRDRWPGTLVIKGILRGDDATTCAGLGVDGIIVSNHGGRQLDQSEATLDALRAVAPAVNVPVLLDGGIRCGSDVLVALARGARGVLVGRPFLYALAAGGEAGVDAMFALLREQVDTALALSGCARAAEAGTLLAAVPGPP